MIITRVFYKRQWLRLQSRRPGLDQAARCAIELTRRARANRQAAALDRDGVGNRGVKPLLQFWIQMPGRGSIRIVVEIRPEPFLAGGHR